VGKYQVLETIGNGTIPIFPGAGIREQIEYAKTKPYRPLTIKEVDKFLNELQMSKKKQKQSVVTVVKIDENMIKSIFNLYKPSKTELFFMKNFKKIHAFVTKDKRVLEISNILNISKDEVNVLIKKYYNI
jgi:hypothetical protein